MHIMFVITGLGMGGAETQVCNLADKLSSRGYQVKIAYLLQPAIVQPKSKDIELIWLGSRKSPLSILKAYINLVRLINNVNPDVVHSHMFHANILARLAKVLTSIPRLVCTAHNTNEGGSLRMLAYRLTNSLGDVFSNVSQEAVEAFEENKAAPKGEMIATHNGIDIDFFKFDEVKYLKLKEELGLANKKIFIAIGRFHEQKDYPNLLNAFSELLKSQVNRHLLIVGDGDLRSHLEKIIIDKGLSSNISLLGVRKNIPELLSVADVFVLSSAWEGFGLVVAEAMACERVVVATNSGGVAEVLGSEGFLVAPKNSDELATAMEKAALLSYEEARVIGKAARQRIVEKYSLDSVVDNWLKIYKLK